MNKKKAKAGRPPKPASALKKRHNLSFTDKEWQRLSEKAQEAELDRSTYIIKTLDL
jgi:hypothetical protein